MKKTLPIFLLVAALAAGCKPTAHRMGTVPVGPPTFRTIPAGANPNTMGISGAYGDIVQNSGGLGAWQLGASGWVVVPSAGGGISPDGGVSAPLTGLGSASSPLAIPVVIPPARVVATSNITLSGTQTIDGRALNVGDHVLAQAQTTAANIGPYVVASGTWSRDPSFSTASQMVPGATITVYDGATGIGSMWQFQTTSAITVGTTALTFSQVNPADFGSNATVSLADSGGTLVPALHLTSALTVNTPGATTSTWTHQLMLGGTQTTTMTETTGGITVRNGSPSFPAYNFAGCTNCGIYWQGNNDTRLVGEGTGVLSYSSSGLQDLLNGTCFKWSNSTGLCQGAANNANAILSGAPVNQGDVQVGAAGALATNATGGWLDVAAMAGAPTGTPTQLSAGKVGMIVDTTNDKVCFNFGGSATWHCATLTP